MEIRKLAKGLMVAAGVSALSWSDMAKAQEKNFLNDLNESGIGTFSGKAQMLLMRRDREEGNPDGSANSGTVALTLNYKSPELLEAISFGLQFIHSAQLFEGGSLDNAEDEAWNLSNSDFTILNEAYIKLNLAALGLEKTDIKVGRQIMNLDFARSFAIRQKAQSYEAAVLTMDEFESFSLTLGHIEKFSSWSSRDVNFRDVEDLEGVNYATRGTEFISATYKGLDRTSITLYDFYAHDLYNTFGAKVAYTLDLNESLQAILKGHYLNQRDVGRMDRDGAGNVKADLLDLAVEFKSGNFSIEPGITTIAGDDSKNDVRVPFRTSLTIDPELLWYTRQYESGTDSYYLKSTYKLGSTKFYALYVYANHEKNLGTAPNLYRANDQEINFVVSHNFNDNLYASFKIGFGIQDNKDGVDDKNANDMRLFVGYKF